MADAPDNNVMLKSLATGSTTGLASALTTLIISLTDQIWHVKLPEQDNEAILTIVSFIVATGTHFLINRSQKS